MNAFTVAGLVSTLLCSGGFAFAPAQARGPFALGLAFAIALSALASLSASSLGSADF